MFFKKLPIGHNLKQLALAVDQLGNALLGITFAIKEKSWADETLSSRCWRWHKDGKRSWPSKLIDILFFWEKDAQTGKRHCEASFESERLQRQLPPELRKVNSPCKISYKANGDGSWMA